MKYLRYLSLPVLVVIGIYFTAKGQYWAWLYLLLLDSIIIGGDAFLGDDKSTPKYQYPSILTALLFINLPLVFLLVCISTYMAGDVSSPIFEQTVLALTGLDIALTRNGTELWHLAGYVFAGGLLVGSAATVPGHELVHHKKKPLDWLMGNWMMAFSWDSGFSIEHVQGHHKNVGLSSDPATAKRGEGLYRFFVRSSIQEHRDAWKIERKRLTKRGHYLISYHNNLILGYARSTLITAIIFLISGWNGVFMFLGIAVIAKLFLEAVNYMEHYGLVRVPGTPVALHHSWNTNKLVSSLLLYNLTRHSHHHEQGSFEFWKLRPKANAPEMPYGYLSTLYLVVFFPWLYRRMMEPKLEHWLDHYATEDERKLALASN